MDSKQDRDSPASTPRGETFDVDYEVTTYEPPGRLDVGSTEGPFPFSGSIPVVEVEGGTEVSNTIDAGSDGLATTIVFVAFGPLLRWTMRRQLAEELDQLALALGDDGPERSSAEADAS